MQHVPRQGADPRHEAWVRALDDLEAATEAAAALAAHGLDNDGAGTDEAGLPALPPVAGVLPWAPPDLDPDYLQTPAGAPLRARALRLRARQNAVTSLLMTAMAVNRRHREVLTRAERPHDRAIYVDETS